MGVAPTAAFLLGAALAALAYGALAVFLFQHSEFQTLTTLQLAAAIGYGVVVVAWGGAEASVLVARMQPRYDAIDGAPMDDSEDRESVGDCDESSSLSSPGGPGARGGGARGGAAEQSICGVKPSHLPALRLAAEFVAIMAYVYFCDRTTLIAKGPKYQSKAAFWCVNGLILAAGLFTLRRAHGAAASAAGGIDEPVKPLQRDQTEEWKGWMQIMFVLYHYFNETEIYNAIRMYIAAYVWMTGFGNFSYYYIKKDFTLVRITQMMWRLNFFVFFVCITMNNEYMLYYICPMHTFFTWGVFVPLYLLKSHNDSFHVLYAKIGATAALSWALYDVGGGAAFKATMAPFEGLLGAREAPRAARRAPRRARAAPAPAPHPRPRRARTRAAHAPAPRPRPRRARACASHAARARARPAPRSLPRSAPP
jgi:hypothetical protein